MFYIQVHGRFHTSSLQYTFGQVGETVFKYLLFGKYFEEEHCFTHCLTLGESFRNSIKYFCFQIFVWCCLISKYHFKDTQTK